MGSRGAAAQTIGRDAAGGTEPAAATAPDLVEVRGQEAAKRALQVAAAGGHSLLLIGPPGAGKTMLAQRFPGLLPPLSDAEHAEVSEIHALADRSPPPGRLRPSVSPHTTTSLAGLIGGGSPPRPGEASLAHHGVLLLDELPEFRRSALDALRQPLEEGRLTLVRAGGRSDFPARFQLIATTRLCACGYHGDHRRDCLCTPQARRRWRRRVPPFLLDQLDLQVEIAEVTLGELRGHRGPRTAELAERVAAARQMQRARLGGHLDPPLNAAIDANAVHRFCECDLPAQTLLDTAFERLHLSARDRHRVLRVARTLADLAGAAKIDAGHMAEAIQYRSRRAEGRADVL